MGLQQSAWLCSPTRAGICSSFLIPIEPLHSPIFQTNSAELFPKSSCSSSSSPLLPEFEPILQAAEGNAKPNHILLAPPVTGKEGKIDNCLQVPPFLLLVFPVTLSQSKT